MHIQWHCYLRWFRSLSCFAGALSGELILVQMTSFRKTLTLSFHVVIPELILSSWLHLVIDVSVSLHRLTHLHLQRLFFFFFSEQSLSYKLLAIFTKFGTFKTFERFIGIAFIHLESTMQYNYIEIKLLLHFAMKFCLKVALRHMAHINGHNLVVTCMALLQRGTIYPCRKPW